MTEPTCASAGTKTNRIRVVGSNFGSAARVTTIYCITYNSNIIPVHNSIMLFILQIFQRKKITFFELKSEFILKIEITKNKNRNIIWFDSLFLVFCKTITLQIDSNEGVTYGLNNKVL